MAQARRLALPAAVSLFLLTGPGSGDVNERAAWTALARVLFNLDEAIMKE